MSDDKPKRKPRPVPRTNRRKASAPAAGAESPETKDPLDALRVKEDAVRKRFETLRARSETMMAEMITQAERNRAATESSVSASARLRQLIKSQEEEHEAYRKQALAEEQQIQILRAKVRELQQQVREAEIKEMDELRQEVHHLRQQLAIRTNAEVRTAKTGHYTHIQARWLGSVPLMWLVKIYWN